MATDKVILQSFGKETFEVDLKVASLSTTLKNMIEDFGCDGPVPVPNVSGNILAKVIEYCKKHTDADPSENLSEWDAEFVNVDHATLFELILAANYLDIKGLLDLTCQCVADMIKDKSPEEIRILFGIENDFTPEEEAKIRSENQWAFE